jgi:hypothetical protein
LPRGLRQRSRLRGLLGDVRALALVAVDHATVVQKPQGGLGGGDADVLRDGELSGRRQLLLRYVHAATRMSDDEVSVVQE